MATRGPKPRKQTTIPLVQEWVAPVHLGDIARREFDRIVELLKLRGTLSQTDATLVVRRAELCETAEAAYRQLLADGVVIQSDRQNLSCHPAVKILVSATTLIKAIDSELALTPSSAKTSTKASPDIRGQWADRMGTGG